MPTIYDNIKQHLLTGLSEVLEVSHKADFCVGYFNLRGWKRIAKYVEDWQGEEENQCRLLIGMHKSPEFVVRDYFNKSEQNAIDTQSAILLKKRLAKEFKEQLMVGIPTEEDENGLRVLSNQLKSKKLVVKLFLRYPLHAKLYLLYRYDKVNPVNSFLGSSNLTLAGLANQGELNVDVQEKDANQKLVTWFEERWNDKFCVDISKELAEIIDTSWASENYTPYQIYLKIAYHLSREARAGLAENTLPLIFQKELLEFQQKAVQIAARHLNKRGGVMIGDVVGLGKTITGTALAKMMEEEHLLETLIICPKNLVEMWEDYTHKYQLRAKIVSITQAQNELPKMRRYRIVMIDESHNLRNREGKRYKVIQEYIQRNESKVILLSATPYNKSLIDLSNQLRLFLPEDRDLGITPENFINSIGGRSYFMGKYQTPIGSLSAFEKSDFIDDWRELMRLYLIRRTRSFIKKSYTQNDPTNNRQYLTFADGRSSYFPDRYAKKVEYDFDVNDPNDQYAQLYSDEIVSVIDKLFLPRYGLGTQQYIEQNPIPFPTPEELIVQSNLGRAGSRLKGFAKTNLFKRLESSGYAFLLSVSRHILRNYIFLYAIENQKPFPIGKQDVAMLDEYLEENDIDNEEITLFGDTTNEEIDLMLTHEQYMNKAASVYALFESKYYNRFDWIGSHLFSKHLQNALNNDSNQLLGILEKGKDWTPQNDRQLNCLYELCTKKHKTEKILIFTQFADTAIYLHKSLKKKGIVNIGCVTGDTENPTEYAHRFSPESNRIKNVKNELRVLITTDVLSEGQNLQDAHIILNYDLPWAIIRLIQRAGRVDRIGQKSDKIYCYSFLPEEGIERIIRLRTRLQSRLEESGEVIGSDEQFFTNQRMRSELETLYNEESGILDEEDDSEVDLASYAYQIWKDATDQNPTLLKTIPDMPEVVYATKNNPQNEGIVSQQNGVIVYARTPEDNDILTWLNDKGATITQSQLTILKTVACEPNAPPLAKIPAHHELVAKGLEVIKEMEKNIGGQLGRHTGVRYRIYHFLKRYYEQNRGTIFVTEALERAIDEIYRYPLREIAKERINRFFKNHVKDDDMVAMITSLREENNLCLISEDDTQSKDPQIICSMGLRL
ncbi:NgoFVII family restriction endonuclease [Runella rosea]|uniref:NgoFVII family restriction endonuclease n=1 Tax=Runella rosea TaxID=2259595 RepID=A0A344THC7_9BACT|nr:helicase-related protein [Runella rosea]AXE18048.1 NgoFVII family restriction endonuclease [Runella rosea]